MKPNEIVKRAKELQEKTRQRKLDRRYLKVIGFLKAKGFLFAEKIEPKPNVKLDVRDVLWVGEKVEPRVLEVFPAAFLHFPKTFFNTRAIPKELLEIINAIKTKVHLDQNFRGIEFKKMNQWANRSLKDSRVKPISIKKVPCSFRLSPEVIQILKYQASSAEISETEFLENLVMKYKNGT